jgi:hypothetical protein
MMTIGIVLLWLFTPWTLTALASTAIRNGIAILAVLTRIPDAVALVHQERERTAAEYDAFEAFARRVGRLDVDGTQQSGAGDRRPATAAHPGPAVVDDHAGASRSASMEAIRDAYRETVMAVPHYEEEYDEPLEEHLAQEFGVELGVAIAQSDAVTPQLQQALATASIRSRDERAELLDRLDEERNSLREASRSLEEICEAVRTVEQSLSRRADRELAEAWGRLEELEGDCRTLLRERQCNLEPEQAGRSMGLQEYLYATSPWTYPILGDGLDGIDRIERAKHRVVETIMRRG